MNKNQVKFLTDIILFSSFSSLLFTGILMWLVIPTGHSGNPYFLGLHRHGWGDIHLFFSIFFVCASFVHLYLNWALVLSLVKKYFGDDKKNLLYIGLSFLPLTLLGWIFKLIAE